MIHFLKRLQWPGLKPALKHGKEETLDSPASHPDDGSITTLGYATDQGRDREYNEDSYYYLLSTVRKNHRYMPFGLFVVADGMGGYEGGEDASERATQIVATSLLQETYLAFAQTDVQAPPRPITEVLVDAVERANRTIVNEMEGAGTTLTAALLMEQVAFIAHVGDSRAYIIEDDTIQHITQDHSLVGRLVQVGAISEQDALTHPQRNIVYRSVGQGEDLETDWFSYDLSPNSQLMLCTDGLWGSVTDHDMLEIIHSAASPQAACEELVRIAREQGSTDDVTVLLVPWNRLSHGR